MPSPPQGDRNIHYYEISASRPHLSYLTEYHSCNPQKGIGECGRRGHVGPAETGARQLQACPERAPMWKGRQQVKTFELMGALLDVCGRVSGSTQEEAREGFLEVARPEQPKGKQSKTWGECGGVAAES